MTPGSIVRLKAGGPNMTVAEVSQSGERVDCLWFDREDHLCRDAFTAVMLEQIKPFNPGDLIPMRPTTKGWQP